MAWVYYDAYPLAQMSQTPYLPINFAAAGDTLKVMLTTVAYVPNQTSDQFKSSVTNEVSGTNYVARGQALTSKVSAVTAHVFEFSCANLTWLQNAGGFSNARIVVLYRDTAVDATSALIAYYDLGSDRGNVAGDLVLGDPSGIFTF